ncbi:hypothetical protein SJZ96_02190 [Acinetobacter baumannii]|nr:hypothetical protein [Acinetobacter baumannii]
MDKKALQEQFEAIAVQNCWNINKYPAGWDGHGDDEYADDFVSGAWWVFQHQQAKVEELQNRMDALEKILKEANEVVELNIETIERIRDKAKDMQERNYKVSMLYLLKPIRRVLEQALKGEG